MASRHSFGGKLSRPEDQLELQIRAAGLPEPEREFRFHPKRRYRADFGWPEHRVLLECEGGQWIQGRHNRPAGYESDCEKYNLAQLMGYQVYRVTPAMVEDGRALELLECVLENG